MARGPLGTALGVRHVFARVTTVDGDAGRIDEVITFVKQTVQPLLLQLPGSLGLAMLVNRDRGRVTVTTAWTTAEARAASDAHLAPIRGEAARLLGGQARPEEFDLAVLDRVRPAAAGYWNRLVRLAVPPDRLETGIAAFRDQVLPALRGEAGFCGGVLLVDRTSGTALGLTTWDSREALEASRAAANQVRARVTESIGATVVEVVESEIVIAGIGAPTQHEDAFRRAYAAMSAGGDLDDLDALVEPDYIEHAALPPGLPSGLAGLKAVITAYREAFPDFLVVIEKYLEQGDLGCAVVRITGTHRGPFMGTPASGRTIDITGIDVVRLVDGRCAEHWGVEDDLGLFAQIGALAIPQQSTTTIELPSQVDA